ncbi:MAG: NYN domain-containing protein [Candidatus Limnocylindrales bacterium]
MSKNVAVFVDVANIFYAAKAAGVDIDYVTLLKTASAGRDFVRAYAYTGLDPENDNQRQFHAFLTRSGYKVVSKDIRKYGDGKVKANLDIELVVDMMRTAQNLDIAVVVSGDGDFAPAIRAVQQMGVRVEVISFRGNTSSDLMDVADTFIDITQIAKVEKDSSRSGRRVAAADDLSMTEVPDKESEGAPRRRRGGRGRAAEATIEAPAEGGRRTATGTELLVLPGEKLSRAALARQAAASAAAATAAAPMPDVPEVPEVAGLGAEDLEAEAGGPEGEAGGRRRRRRRGGRGRGRGRGSEPELTGTEAGTVGEGELAEDEEGVAYVAPRAPQHGAFGSVWDSQRGMATPPAASTPPAAEGPVAEDEGYEDEPEIPEYLLAERRQQAGRPGGGRGPVPPGGRGGRGRGRGGAYQVALDRERYGRSGTGGSSFNAPSPRREPAGRPDRGPRPSRPPFREAPPPTSGGEPWSEVPPELEELLRAELARKAPAARPVAPPAPLASAPVESVAASAPKRRVTRKVAAPAAPSAAAEPVVEAAAKAGPKRRVTRKAASSAVEPGAAEPVAEPPVKAAPKRRTTRKAPPTDA